MFVDIALRFTPGIAMSSADADENTPKAIEATAIKNGRKFLVVGSLTFVPGGESARSRLLRRLPA